MTKTTALAVRGTTAPALTTAPEPSFPDLVSMGQQLVGTGFMPNHIKNGAQAAAIIMAGREIGLPPMRALRSLALISGKIVEAADSQLSRFKSDGGRAVFEELTDTRAVLHLTHPNGDRHSEAFTMDDAKKAGISGHMYTKFPKAMLRSRCITAALKSIGWEGGAGVYDPSELDASEPVREPQAPAVVEDADVIDETPDGPSEKQKELLEKLLTSHVFTDAERAKVARKITTKASCTGAIDWATSEITKRKAAEKAARVVEGAELVPVDGEAVMQDPSKRAAARGMAQAADPYESQEAA